MQKKTVLSSILIFVLGISLGAYIVYANPISTFYISSGVYPHGLYTMWKEGNYYYTKTPFGEMPSYSGTTNFTTQFQTVINTVSSTGGRIFLKTVSNWYLVENKIVIPANTHGIEIYGEGFGTRLLLQANVNQSMFDIAENCTRITLRDMRLSGNSANNVNSHCIQLAGHNDWILLENLYINEFADRGVSGGNGDYASLQIKRCFISGCGTISVYLNNAHSSTLIEDSVLGNTVETGQDYLPGAVIHLYSCRGVNIVNSGVFCGRYGLRVEEGRNVKIINTYAHVNQEIGIWLEGTTHASITNCFSYSNGQNVSYSGTGLLIYNSTYVKINGLDCLNNLGWFSSPFTDNSQDYGIRELGVNADYNMILDSTARGNSVKDILSAVGANTQIHDCWNGTTWIS